jgi:hypothetical protein
MCVVKSTADDDLQALLPQLDRNTAPNKKLIKLKINKKLFWNHTMLRFNWHEDFCVSSVSKKLDGRYSEANKMMTKMMAKSPNTRNAFAMRNWAKNIQNACGSSAASPLTSSSPNNICNDIGCH